MVLYCIVLLYTNILSVTIVIGQLSSITSTSICLVDSLHRHPSDPRRNVTKWAVIQDYRVFCLCIAWCPCMVINVIVHYNGGFLPESLLFWPKRLLLYGSMAMLYYYYPLNYVLQWLLFCYAWWLCMAINTSVQYNGGLLPDIILLNQGYYHRGTRLNTM